MSRRLPVLALLCALVAVPGCTGRGAVSTDSGTERFTSGDGVATYVSPSRRAPAPALSGEALDGSSLDLAAWRGAPLVVNVWGSWCAPCKKEQGPLERVWRATRSRGVHFVGINVRDPSRTPARRHVAAYGVTYPSLYDPSSRLLPRFAVAPKSIPTTYVVDSQWRIAAYVYGETTEQSLTTLLDRVLAET